MGNFVGLGRDVAAVAKACADNNDKKDVALFLIAQQDMLQEQVIKNRQEGNNKPNTTATTGGGTSGNKLASKAASSAKAKLKAALSELK